MDQFTHGELQHVIRRYDDQVKKFKSALAENQELCQEKDEELETQKEEYENKIQN